MTRNHVGVGALWVLGPIRGPALEKGSGDWKLEEFSEIKWFRLLQCLAFHKAASRIRSSLRLRAQTTFNSSMS